LDQHIDSNISAYVEQKFTLEKLTFLNQCAVESSSLVSFSIPSMNVQTVLFHTPHTYARIIGWLKLVTVGSATVRNAVRESYVDVALLVNNYAEPLTFIISNKQLLGSLTCLYDKAPIVRELAVIISLDPRKVSILLQSDDDVYLLERLMSLKRIDIKNYIGMKTLTKFLTEFP
jgi:hypothetical protein